MKARRSRESKRHEVTRAPVRQAPPPKVRAPAHGEHRFQRIVNADSGIVNTDSSAS
jgi:hypothetical protein